MPRPKNYILHALLGKNEENKIVCNNGNCNGKILNSHPGNLERHLKKLHPDVFSVYIRKKSDGKNIIPLKPIPVKSKIVSSDLNRSNIELAIVELFTKNGWPLHMAGDRAFKMLVEPVFNALGESISEQNVNERITAFSLKLRTEIMEDLKGKLLSLKIDAATRQGLSAVGINVQYIKNNCIQIKTLSVKELKPSHNSEYIKSVILQVLNEFAININQILTITTDNGANMLKAVKDLNEDLQISIKEENADKAGDEEYVDCSEEKLQSIRSYFSSYNITGVRCGAHTLQLCVHDVIQKQEIQNKLETCRSVVLNFRTQTYLKIFKNGSYNIPVLDCVTKWDSTFVMLEQLLKIKDIVDPLSAENTSLYLSSEEWNFVREFVETFKPIYSATTILQSAQLCFSELYIIIMDISLQLENLASNEMTTLLINSLNKRKDKLFNNELFNAAVFLDPRIKICLSAMQKERAKKYITCLYNRMNEIASEAIDSSTVDKNLEGPSTSNRTSAKSFSEYLQNLDPDGPEPTSSILSHLEVDFVMYDRQSRSDLNSNIIDYWSAQNNTFLSGIAQIILAIPTTQVSLERLFSALKYILSNQHNRLTDSNVEHILMVKANGTFNYED